MLPRKFHEIEVRLFCKDKHLPGIQCTHCSESERYVYNYSAGFYTGYNNYSGIKIHTCMTTHACKHCKMMMGIFFRSFEEFVKKNPATFGDLSGENKAYLSKSKAKNL